MQKVDQAVEEFAKEVQKEVKELLGVDDACLLYTSWSDRQCRKDYREF